MATSVTWLLALGGLVWFLVPALRDRSLVPGLILLTFAIFVLAYISRRYITRLQDRIIKVEMRMRCRDLMGAGADATLDRLTRGQVVALRFASDEELPSLLNRAERDSMAPDDIKRAIRDWRADWDRT